MEIRSLSRRQVVFGGGLLAGVGLLLEACGDSPLGPGQASAKPTVSPLLPSFGGLPRRLQVKQAIHVFSTQPLSPLQALQSSNTPYEAVDMEGGKFVTSVKNTPDLWVFVVDGIMPDLSGASVVTRLGKIPISSPEEAQRQLPRFPRGTMGLSLATGATAIPPSAGTEFAPIPGQDRVLVSWLQVGLMQPDTV